MELQKTQQAPGVFIGTLDMVGYHNSLHHKSGILIPSRHRIFHLSLSIYFQKYSFLMHIFTEHISSLLTAGFIQKQSEFYEKMYAQHRVKQMKPNPLAFEHIKGICSITACAFAICSVVLLAEMISMRIRCLQILFDYL